MSRFMENLLSRHREGSAETRTVSLVQPRPKARFESDLSPTAVTVPDTGLASPSDFEQDILSPLSDNHLETTSLFRSVPVIAPLTVGTDGHIAGKQEWLHKNVDRLEFQGDLVRPGGRISAQSSPVQSLSVLPEQENKVQEPAGRSNTRQSAFQHELSEPVEQTIPQSSFSASDGLSRKTDTLTLQFGILSEFNAQPYKRQATLPSEQQPLDDLIIGAPSSQSPVLSPVTQPAIEQQSLSSGFRQQLRTIQQHLNAQQPQEAEPATSSAEQVVSKSTDRIPFQAGKQSNRAVSVASEPDRRIQEILHRLNALQKDNGKPEPVQSEQQEVRLAAREITRPISSNILTGEEKLGQPLSATALNRQLHPLLHRLNHEQGQEGRKKQARPGKPPVSSNEIFAPTGRRKAKNKAEQQQDGRSIASQSGQAALLQPPAWLASVQADLENRRQQSSPQSGSEPIINITIGRIEIRAVQSKSATMQKNSQKPSGIMSLDDYLKQRENRGRI